MTSVPENARSSTRSDGSSAIAAPRTAARNIGPTATRMTMAVILPHLTPSNAKSSFEASPDHVRRERRAPARGAGRSPEPRCSGGGGSAAADRELLLASFSGSTPPATPRRSRPAANRSGAVLPHRDGEPAQRLEPQIQPDEEDRKGKKSAGPPKATISIARREKAPKTRRGTQERSVIRVAGMAISFSISSCTFAGSSPGAVPGATGRPALALAAGVLLERLLWCRSSLARS